MNRLPIIFMFITGIAQASNWQLVSSTKGMKVYIDSESISRNGSYQKAWLIYTHDTDQAGDVSTSFKTYKSSKTLEYFSCAERQNTSTQAIYYADENAQGSTIGIYNLPIAKATFSEVAPDTVGEVVLKFVCSRKK